MAVESYEKLMGDLKKLRLPAMIEMLDSYAGGIKQYVLHGLPEWVGCRGGKTQGTESCPEQDKERQISSSEKSG